jgi:hypothetical protein
MTSLDCPQNIGALPGKLGTGPNAAPTGMRDERQSWRGDDHLPPRQGRESLRGQAWEGIKDDRERRDRHRSRSVERDEHGYNRGRSRFSRDDKYRDSQSPKRDQKYDDDGRWKERRRSRSLDARNGGDEKRRRMR